MVDDIQEVEVLKEIILQDILDAINGNDTMYNIVDTLIGKINEAVNTHESTMMTIDSALDKAMKAGQYDAMDYLTLSKQVIAGADRELMEAIKIFQELLDELNRTSGAIHRIEEVIVDKVSDEKNG